MKNLKIALVCAVCVIFAGTQGSEPVTSKDIPVGPTPSANYTTSSAAPPTPPPTTSTPKTTTTSSTTPATTTKVTTPTTPTTAKPTPTPITTTKPTTSATTAKPTPTTPAPIPGKPDVGSWNVTKPGTNITCILSKMALQIEVDYEEKNQTRKAILNIPVNATANGTCDNNKTNQLSLKWSGEQNSTNYITFNFLNNTNTSEVSLDNILVTLNGLHALNDKTPMNFLYNHTVFKTPLKHSYKCNKQQSLDLINAKNDTNCKAVLKVSQLQVEAFRTSNTTNFENPIDCITSTPDIVPIAVGCALAALVVIVLLAYLYGRRRSQARGYLSM